MSVRKGPGGPPPSAEGETKKKPVSKNDFLTALKEEVHQKKFQRDQIVGELAKLDYNHQRESLEDQNDVSEAISEIHLNSAISPLAKAVVPDMLKSRHTLNRERKDQLLRDLHKIEKQIDKLHETIDAIAPKKHHYYCVDTYQYEKWFGECCAEYFPERQDPHNDQKFMPEEVEPYHQNEVKVSKKTRGPLAMHPGVVGQKHV